MIAKKKRAKPQKTELSYVIGKGYRVKAEHARALFGVIRDRFKGEKPSPQQLITEAKTKRSPIHGLFEWDAREAAKHHWHNRAQYYLRAIQVVVVRIDTREVVKGPVRAFIPTRIEADGRIPEESYIPVHRLQDDPQNVEIVLRRAEADFRSWFARYKRYSIFLNKFGPVIKAFERTMGKKK